MHVFPPALVPVLRGRLEPRLGALALFDDDVLIQLLTTVFFAGLDTYEGERNPIKVVFVGRDTTDLVMPEGAGSALVYRWKLQRFGAPRPFVIPELVKLAAAGDGIHSAVHVSEEERLEIVALARPGLSADADPFFEIFASKPGCLSIRSGRERLLEYERGSILTGGEDILFASGPVRRALEAIARSAGLDEEVVPDYLDVVRALVRETGTHGHGGMLVVNPEEVPSSVASASYRMMGESSLASLLRLSRRIGRRDSERPSRPNLRLKPPEGEDRVAFGHLLRNAFLAEMERIIEEVGALTAIDGAAMLNRSLALVAFGVILPVHEQTDIAEAADAEGTRTQIIDLGTRGTRHRAGATYAAEHPGSVVFVVSEDGPITCMYRDPSKDAVVLWRVGPAVPGDPHLLSFASPPI